MKFGYAGSEAKERIPLTLPTSLKDELDAFIAERNISRVEAIRQAIACWLEYEIKQEMAEGYEAVAQEDAQLMSEFEYVDQEGW